MGGNKQASSTEYGAAVETLLGRIIDAMLRPEHTSFELESFKLIGFYLRCS